LKKIICLAKSHKISGYCIAGKEILYNGTIGGWIRPVSSRIFEEISKHECKMNNNCETILLDIVKIPVMRHNPSYFQCENHLIDENITWKKEGVFQYGDLINICDNPEYLWNPDNSSGSGIRDRIKESDMEKINNSLYLISPTNLTIYVKTEGEYFGNPRRRVRALFTYNGTQYKFSVTDLVQRNTYLEKDDGKYIINTPENNIFMCISLGLLHTDKYCYKLVSSIIGL
jgi:hypothetical protein